MTCWLGLATACTSSRVHLFTEGLSDSEHHLLVSQLNDAGYDVVNNTLPVPEGIVAPTIVYSPMHQNLADVERLRDLFAAAGFTFDLEPISSGNHFYTGINVGVYPKKFLPGRPREISIMGKELFGDCTRVDATLALGEDLTFEAELIGWNETSQAETIRRQAGTWWLSGQVVVLSVANKQVRFELVRFSDSTDYARVDGVRLINQYDQGLVDGCDFVYRELDPW